MPHPLATVLVSAILALGAACRGSDVPALARTGRLEPELDVLVDYLTNPDTDYTQWKRFPRTPALMRLGLPVHGRWATTYVNDEAHAYIERALSAGDLSGPLDFPAGSWIVKENYRSKASSATRIDASESELKVLTFMYKPDPSHGYCATTLKTNGTDCFGGGWFYGFHMLEKPEGPPPEDVANINAAVNEHVASFCVTCHAPAFNTDYVRTLRRLRDPFSAGGSEDYCAQFTPVPTTRPEAAPPADLAQRVAQEEPFGAEAEPTLSSRIPPDVAVNPTLIWKYYGSARAQRMFDELAWKTFIALNWENVPPAADRPWRGRPAEKAFWAERTGPTVWETYKPTYEFFQPGRKDWDPSGQEWDQPMVMPDCKSGDEPAAGSSALTMASKTRDAVNETGQAFAGTFGYLVDRNGKKVRYEVLVNRTEFEYLIADNRATTAYLTPSGPLVAPPPAQRELQRIEFPDDRTDEEHGIGAIEVKSAWKELAIGSAPGSDAPDMATARADFYVRNLVIYDEATQTCRNADMALIGLHIAHKTHWAPQWIWMTFEHERNVPAHGEETSATFFAHELPGPDGGVRVLEESPDAWKYPFLAPPVVGFRAAGKYSPNVDLNRFLPNGKDQPNQLTRLVEIEPQAQLVNQRYQALLASKGSPFAHYILVSAQWPLDGRNASGAINRNNSADNVVAKDHDSFTMVPRFLRNTVIESYMATYCTVKDASGKDVNRQFSNRSCMGCHGNAGTDFSYMWLDAVSQRVPLGGD